MFQTDVDVANRALQHCGVPRIDPSLGFTEVSQRAQETSFAYGKIKRAELEENVWTFATRRAPLRPMDSNTMLVSPTLWQSGTTYFKGSIVIDQNGFIWQSTIPTNLGAQPGTPGEIFAWKPYFGPLTAALYDSTVGYDIDELVYITPGDGTSLVYLSLYDGNAVDPSLRNVWNANMTYSQNQVVVVYPAWAVGTTYAAGSTVLYTDGNTYTSLAGGNVGNIPPSNPTQWALTPILSLTNPTGSTGTATSSTIPASTSPIIEWLSTTTYSLGNFVLSGGHTYIATSTPSGQPPGNGWTQLTGDTAYMSLIDLNTNNNPSSAPALWASGTTYATGNKVGASDGNIYTSLSNGNIGNNPVTDAGVHWQNTGVLNPWTTVFTQGTGNQQWLQIGGALSPSGVALTTPELPWPRGSGPTSDMSTKNLFRLPAGYLRLADQNLKSGIVSWLGAPGNPPQNDWTFEGNYLISWEFNPIILRFVADVVDVSQFPSTFCEALAARLGMEVCPILDQSTAKTDDIRKEYLKWIGIAVMKSGIEKGAVMPPLDDLIACRY